MLEDKHSHARPTADNSLLYEPVDYVDPINFDAIDSQAICNAALNVHGAAGPLGLDAGWRRMCCLLHAKSSNLCEALAAVVRRLCTTFVDPKGVEALVACRLIPLNKNSGIRQIGVGEVPRQFIIPEAIIRVIKPDILSAVGSLQFMP